MKTISANLLDANLYHDRKKTIPVLSDVDPALAVTVREYLHVILDAVVQNKTVDRARVRSINRCHSVLDQAGDIEIEDADYEFLKQHVDNIGIKQCVVAEQIFDVIDSATQVIK